MEFLLNIDEWMNVEEYLSFGLLFGFIRTIGFNSNLKTNLENHEILRNCISFLK